MCGLECHNQHADYTIFGIILKSVLIPRTFHQHFAKLEVSLKLLQNLINCVSATKSYCPAYVLSNAFVIVDYFGPNNRQHFMFGR